MHELWHHDVWWGCSGLQSSTTVTTSQLESGGGTTCRCALIHDISYRCPFALVPASFIIPKYMERSTVAQSLRLTLHSSTIAPSRLSILGFKTTHDLQEQHVVNLYQHGLHSVRYTLEEVQQSSCDCAGLSIGHRVVDPGGHITLDAHIGQLTALKV